MSSFDARNHWNSVYASKASTEMSWFQSDPSMSLALCSLLEVRAGDEIIDIGGGTSFLVDRLLEHRYADLTVLDVSSHALDQAKARLGHHVGSVAWISENILDWTPPRDYHLWHDRAVFHFLTDPDDRSRYITTLRSALRPGGCVIIATFADDGPEKCSNLPVMRYSADELATALGPAFQVVEARREEHRTPWGSVQPFTWLALRS